MSKLMGLYVSNGYDLFKVVDTFKGDSASGPLVFLENVQTNMFNWIPFQDFQQLMKVHPD